jgi:NitT/TauT family transport system substrate-binding protein
VLVLLSHLLCSFLVFGAETSTQLALNWKPEPQFGGFYAADFGGHFKKNGLKVEILPGGAGTPTVQMIAAGKMDFGIVSADEVVMSQSRGGDVVALFAAYQTNPQGIMVHAERGVTSLKDLYSTPGTLAIQKGLPYALYLEKQFPKPAVQIVPYLGGIANFLSDTKFSQQCFVTSEPLAAEKAGARTKTFLVADAGYNPYTTVLVTRRDVLTKNPKLVKAMVEAVRAGWREYLDKPEATNKRMGELNKAMDANTFIESAKAQKHLIETEETKKLGLGAMTEERWATLAKQLLEIKLIPKTPETKGLFQNL